MLSGKDLDEEERPDDGELDNFCANKQNDVGYESAHEEHIWIWPGHLAQPFDEDTLVRDFVAFKAVQDAKLAIRRPRGFFSQLASPHFLQQRKVKRRAAANVACWRCGERGLLGARRTSFVKRSFEQYHKGKSPQATQRTRK